MASPTRNPKDLRTIISANHHLDGDCNVDEVNCKLEESKKETEMLRSRIDEQCQLICILKRRADEYVLRNQTLEGINRELELLREQGIEQCNMESKRNEMLELRFNELAENHEEMIKFKDEHKRRNELLLTENAKLRKDNENLFSEALRKKENIISNLNAALNELEKKFQDSTNHQQLLQKKLDEAQEEHNNKINALETELIKTKEKLKQSEKFTTKAKQEFEKLKGSRNGALSHLENERDDLLDQVMQRGKLLQEKQANMETLENELKQCQKELEDAEEKFVIMEDRVNVNSRVMKLEEEKGMAEAQLDQLQKEYEAFRVHSNKLLSQEKELNYKLRHSVLA